MSARNKEEEEETGSAERSQGGSLLPGTFIEVVLSGDPARVPKVWDANVPRASLGDSIADLCLICKPHIWGARGSAVVSGVSCLVVPKTRIIPALGPRYLCGEQD